MRLIKAVTQAAEKFSEEMDKISAKNETACGELCWSIHKASEKLPDVLKGKRETPHVR